jgi:hypothetical protein
MQLNREVVAAHDRLEALNQDWLAASERLESA